MRREETPPSSTTPVVPTTRVSHTSPIRVPVPGTGDTAPQSAGLGQVLSVHRLRALSWGELFFVFLPASLLVMVPLAYGLWRAYYAYTHFGPAAAGAWARPWFSLATLALIPLTLLACYRLYISNRSVIVHANGLRLRLSPFKNRRLPWSELAGIASAAYQDRFLGLPLRLRQQVSLFQTDGRAIHLDGRLQNLPSLARQIKSNLYPRIYPAMLERLQAGQTLKFGRLAINQRGLNFARRQVSWDQVSRLGVRSGYLVVELNQGTPLRLAVAHIPNLEILLQMVERGINR